MSEIVPWFANPPDATHVMAADVIARIWLRDTETGDATARLTWVADGMLPEELSPLRAIFLISGYYTELGKQLVETTWVADGVTDDEVGLLTVVASYVARGDTESVMLLLESSWIVDGITREELKAAEAIERIALFFREFGRRLISSSLVVDGLKGDERKALEGALFNIARRDIEHAIQLLGSPWIADGITTEERYALEAIDGISAIDPELGKQLAASPLLAGGLSGDELRALDGALSYIAGRDIELAMSLLASPWVADGITTEERYALEAIDRVSAIDRELGKQLVASPLMADGLSGDELRALDGALSRIAGRDIELAAQLLASSWVADGISAEERNTLEAIDRISAIDRELGKWLVESHWVADGLTNRETHVLNALDRVSEHPDSFRQLTAQSWFGDGLDDEEAAFVIALGGDPLRSPKLFEDLLIARYTQHRTISLPLAGEVDIWVVGNSPPPNENLLAIIEHDARLSEEYIGAPFPIADIILLNVDPRTGNYGLSGGRHYDSHISAIRSGSGGLGPVSHEMAHYYFDFGPGWLREGGADFLSFYVAHNLDESKIPSLQGLYCSLDESGIENIRHYSYLHALSDRDIRVRVCVYVIGRNFLVRLFKTIGWESMSSALRELHLSDSELGQSISEEEVYQAFLKHTPSDREEQFVDLYRRSHGGVFAFPDTDFSDQHSDEATGASDVSVGESVEGALDYMFDFDFFRFRPEQGRRYRVNVEHDTLRSSHINLYAPDGQTLEMRSWRSSSLAPYGPQMLWTASSSDVRYFVVQNFSGQTGPYTLTITEIDNTTDDHGDDAADATEILIGETVEVAVDDDFDHDYIRFQAVGGQSYRIDVASGTVESFFIRLYASDGVTLIAIRNSEYLDQWVAPRSGQYYVVLDGAYHDIGKYKLKITQAEN